MGKSKKDPNRPKRALTAFMFFSVANRARIVQENPGLNFGQIGSCLGKEWRELGDEDRAPYVAKAAEDKLRYEKEMENYTPTEIQEQTKTKRAMTAYLFFCKEHRDEVKEKYPELKMTDVQKRLGEMWKHADDDEKQPFIKQAEADKKRYYDEVAKNEGLHDQTPEGAGW